MSFNIGYAAKAIYAFIIAFLGSVGTALVGTTGGIGQVTASQWITALVLGLTAGGVVFGVSNSPSRKAAKLAATRTPPTSGT